MPQLKVGELCLVKGHGQVDPGLQMRDINCLEALAAFYAVKCFSRDRKSITVLLRMDNTTVVMYVNKLGQIVYNPCRTLQLMKVAPSVHLHSL